MSQLLHLTATTMCRNSKQVNTPPLGYSVRGKRHNASRKCLHAWADRRGSTHWVSQQQRLEYEPIHHDSTQWLIHALNHIITQFGSTINVLINLKGPKVYVILVILIGASLSPRSRKTCPKFSHVTSLLTSITDLIYRQCIATNNTNHRLNL